MKRCGRLIIFSILALASVFTLQAANTVVTPYPYDDVGAFNSLALSNGQPVISFADLHRDSLRLSLCTLNCNANNARYLTQLVDANHAGFGSALVLYNAIRPYISYLGQGDVKIAICTAFCRSVSPTYIITTLDAHRRFSGSTAIALFAGWPAVSYYNLTDGDLRLAYCINGCATATPTYVRYAVDTAGDVGWYQDLALTSNGQPILAYYDRTNGDLKVAICTARCLTNTPTFVYQVVDSVGNVGQHISLALNADKPVISYYDVTNRNLKVAVCTANCFTSSATYVRQTVAATGSVGLATSIALNNGQPVVSYYDATGQTLQIAVCTANCASPTPQYAFKILANNGGSYTSLVLNGANPVVAYYDWTGQDLKVVSCDTPTCGGTLSPSEGMVSTLENGLSFTLNDPFLLPNESSTGTISTTNPLDTDLTNAVLTLELPPALEFQSLSSSHLTENGSIALGTLPSGSNANLDLQLRVRSTAQPPYDWTALACLSADQLAEPLCGSVHILSVEALPATGEPPLWAILLRVLLWTLGGLVGLKVHRLAWLYFKV